MDKMELNNEEVVKKLIKCINFSAIKHRNQRRSDPQSTPFINHPIGVAFILTNEGDVGDLDVIQAALLHDTVEDTKTTFEEIEEHFGPIVTHIVRELTDDKSLPKCEQNRLQIEHARNSSQQAKLVKLADKLYNLRDIERAIPRGWSRSRAYEYFLFSKKVVDGLRGTNASIEKELDKLFRKYGLMS